MGELSQKTCKKCGQTKPLSEFYTHLRRPSATVPPAALRQGAQRVHYRKTHPVPERSASYIAIHIHLLAHYPKTGICEECAAGKPSMP